MEISSYSVIDWQERAFTYQSRQDYNKLVQLYEQAFELEPDITSHYWNLDFKVEKYIHFSQTTFNAFDIYKNHKKSLALCIHLLGID